MSGSHGSQSSVFSGSLQQQQQRINVPTHSMEATLAPLRATLAPLHAQQSTSSQAIVVDSAKRQRMLSDAQSVQAILTKLQQSVTQIEVDPDLGLTAGIRHRISMDYDSAVEHAEDMTTCIRQQGPSHGSSPIALEKLVVSSQAILLSVTSALYAFDQTIVIRIEGLGNQISRLGEELSSVLMATTVPVDRLQEVLKSLSDTVVKFAAMTNARLKDLKDLCQQSDMDCCRVTMEHCFRTLMSSIKVMLQHSSLSICRMNCLAVKDNFMEIVAVMVRAAAVPYDNSMWRRATPLAQEFDRLEELLSHASDDLAVDSKKEQCGGELCRQLDAIILHAKQVAESPRTGDRAGDRLLQCCAEAVGSLATLLQLASEDEDKLLNGSGISACSDDSPFSGSTVSMSKAGSRRSSVRSDRLSRSSNSFVQPASLSDAVDALAEAVDNLRKLTRLALSQHTSAALAQMHRDRSLVDYLHENAAVRNNAKTSDYSSQLLRQVERFEEVVTSVCGVSIDLANVLRAKRSLAELRVLCPQAVAAAHTLFQFPASKAARSNMSSFEHAWHVEVDQLMAALGSLGPSENAKRESMAFDRSKSASMHALSGPRLSTATVHRTTSINSFANFRERLQQRRTSEQVKGRLYASQPDVHFATADL